MAQSLISIWAASPGEGRRSLASGLADAWSDQDLAVLRVTLDGPVNGDLWLQRFQSLPSPLVRQALRSDDGLSFTFGVSEPRDAATARRLWTFLGKTFDRVLVLPPAGLAAPSLPLLDVSQAMLWLHSTPSEASFNEFLSVLTDHHVPVTYCYRIENRASAGAIHPAPVKRHVLATLEDHGGCPARLVAPFQRLAQALDNPALQKPVVAATSEAQTLSAAEQLKQRIEPELLRALEEAPLEKAAAQKTVEAFLAEDASLPASREVRGDIVARVLDDVLGLGPLEPLLQDPSISEIMVNGHGTVFLERGGLLTAGPSVFRDEKQLRVVIDRIVGPLGRRVDESTPLCDARLPDGSRVNVVLPPLALDGPVLTIRKFHGRRLSLTDLAAMGSMNAEIADFLTAAVRSRKNILVSGGTGSGKTTLLNALSSAIPDDERIVTIEDAAELRLQKPHVVRLESRPANAEGQGEITIRRLLVNALRMRPDRIVVGECRGGEALDMLQAMNTGHDGSLTTLHANAPRDALGRLETLVLMAGVDLPVRVVREQIRSAVHVIVQQSRLSDGRRCVTSVTEVTGMEGDTLVTQELFAFRDRAFTRTGTPSRALTGRFE